MTNNMDEKKKSLFESAPVLRAIFSLAIPSIIGQLILVIYNMADTFFIGMACNPAIFGDAAMGSELVAGVTICMPVYMFLSAISNLFGIGAASVISRSLGKGNPWRAKHASRFAFWGCLFTTVIYCLLAFLLVKPLANFLSGNPVGADIAPGSTAYHARTYILFCVCIFGVPTALNTLFSHLMRAEGKSLHASIGIALGGVLNVALDPLFMFAFFELKDAAMAAALATGVSNTIALIYYLVLFIAQKKKLVISIKFSPKSFTEGIPGEVLKIGLPACLMTLCENISYMILDNLVGSVLLGSSSVAVIYGVEIDAKAALAGVGVAKKINMLAHSIVRGMTQGVLPLIGYNKTSGNRKRMARIVYVSGAISVGVAAICMVASLIFANGLSQIFVHDDSSIVSSMMFLRILCIGAPFSAVAYTVISFFQAVGKPWRSLILALLRKGILDIPLMYIFFAVAGKNVNLGPELIVMATPIADVIACVTAIVMFLIYLKHNGQNKGQFAKPLPTQEEAKTA